MCHLMLWQKNKMKLAANILYQIALRYPSQFKNNNVKALNEDPDSYNLNYAFEKQYQKSVQHCTTQPKSTKCF